MTGQQLKNSILQLAIQGKLVPQNPADEPASELLKRIRAEKEKLVKEKKLKKSALDVTPISEDDKPSEIPEGWEWVKVKDAMLINPKVESDDDNDAAFIPMEHIKACYGSSYTYEIAKWGNIRRNYTCFADGDVAFAKITPCFQNRKSMILENLPNGVGAGTTELKVLRPYGNTIFNKYLLFFLASSYFVDEASFKGTANQQRIIVGYLENKLFPLPPLQEQHRIVEKIEELLPLVDKYDKAQKRFDVLNANIPEALKKSILQEAIQGKLGTNNPDDEPASDLLKRIRAEKEKLVKEKKIKKEKPLPEISEDEKPFEIPDNWVWCRLGDLVSNRAGLAYNKSSLEIKSNSMIRVLRGGNINYGEWVTLDNDVMISSEFVKDDLILKKGMFITPAVTSLECMGKTALIREDQTDIVVGGFVLMFIPTLNDVDLLEYLNLLFQSYYYKLYCQSITNKSGQAFFNISRQKLMECLIPLPPLQEQHRIVEKLNNILPKLKKI